MLKLLVYAPCEKVIIAQDQTASIISIMESIKVNVSGELPADALAPIQWSVLSLWKRDEEVPEPVEIEERSEVLRPDGTVAAGGTAKLIVSNEHLFYRNLVKVPVFPVGLAGFVKVRCQTRRTNPETEWVEFAEYPLLVVHLPVQIEEETKQAIDAAVAQAAPQEAEK